jgi:hypothetical protein
LSTGISKGAGSVSRPVVPHKRIVLASMVGTTMVGSLLTMGIATFLIGLFPTVTRIGLLVPALLTTETKHIRLDTFEEKKATVGIETTSL